MSERIAVKSQVERDAVASAIPGIRERLSLDDAAFNGVREKHGIPKPPSEEQTESTKAPIDEGANGEVDVGETGEAPAGWLPNAHGAGLVVLRIVGLLLFLVGVNVLSIPANRIIDRIVLGYDEAPLPEPFAAFFFFGLTIGIGTALLYGILWVTRGTRFDRWARKNTVQEQWLFVEIIVATAYIITMSLVLSM